MSSVQVIPPIPSFLDVDGSPLEDGYIFVGVADQNPESSPVSAFWDIGLTVPATQPIRTRGGFPSNGGQPSKFYVGDVTYSVIVKNKNGTPVHSVANSQSATDLEVRLADEVDPNNGSGLVGFIQDGINAVGMTARDKMKERVSILDFMTDAERADTLLSAPLLDHTSAFQAALDYVGDPSRRQRVLIIPDGRRYRISSVTIKTGTEMRFDRRAIPDFANNTYTNAVGSIIYMIGSGTINVQQGCSIIGGTIVKDGLTFPQTAAQVATWTGTAITAPFGGFTLQSMVILGFATCVNNSSSRGRYFDVLMDGLNGLDVSNSFDVTYITRCHAYPYASLGTGNPADLARPGIAFNIHDTADWAKLNDCFSYGFGRGFRFSNVLSVTAVSCSSDNISGSTGIGFLFEGTTTGEIRLDSPQTAATQVGIQISSTHSVAAANTIHITNPIMWTHANRAILINSAAKVVIRGGKIRGTPEGVTIANAGASGVIDGVYFAADVSTECVRHSTSGDDWKVINNTLEAGGSGRMETASKVAPSVAIAATLSPSRYRPVTSFTGGATVVTSISSTQAQVGDLFTGLFVTAGHTITNNANIATKSGANIITTANQAVSFRYFGNSVWREV